MENFENNYYNQEDLWEEELRKTAHEMKRFKKTRSLIPHDVSSILDVGCGEGSFLRSLDDNYEKMGFDVSKEALKHIEGPTTRGDISSMPFSSNSYDLLSVLEVLEHLSYPKYKKAISEIERVSKNYIIVSVPNDENLEQKLVNCPKCYAKFNSYRHVRSFTPDRLKHLFENFEVTNLLEIGPVITSHNYPTFLVSAYKSWKKPAPPETAICPQCGYSPTGEKKAQAWERGDKSSLKTTVVSVLKSFVKTIWKLDKKRRWLLALYESKL